MDWNQNSWDTLQRKIQVFGRITAPASSSNINIDRPKQINDYVYEVCKPSKSPSIELVFFHGLGLDGSKEVYLTTWLSADGSQLWLDWILKEFPDARILLVSYEHHMGMYRTSENLVQDLTQGAAQVGQAGCPVVFVGHCLGGLVMKDLCTTLDSSLRKLKSQDHIKTARQKKLISNLKGLFFYACPHQGSRLAFDIGKSLTGSFFEDVDPLSVETQRRNEDFRKLRTKYGWETFAVCEGCPVTLGQFQDYVVTEQSARYDVDGFYTDATADHFAVCRPESRISSNFIRLLDFIDHVLKKAAESIHIRHGLPIHPIQLTERALEVQKKMTGGAVIGIFGMGGIGKTTLAKQVFNSISQSFEYTCFVADLKLIKSDEIDKRILESFHCNGMKPDRNTEWFHLREKKTLIVLDDIDKQVQLKDLPELQYFGKGSCLLMTSRNRDIFNKYESCVIHEVNFLEKDDAKELFCQHAFKAVEDIPDSLITYVDALVEKCDGLPLTLEVIGSHLRGQEENVKMWAGAIDKLGKAKAIGGDRTDDRVWASLRVSYDALEDEEQEMFQEAAMIFFQERLDIALGAWTSLTKHMETAWTNLVSKSLVKEYKTSEYIFQGDKVEIKRVWVHEHLRDLAKQIAGVTAEVSKEEEEANLYVGELNAKTVQETTKSLRLSHSIHFRVRDRTELQDGSLGQVKQLKYLRLTGVPCRGRGMGLTKELSLLMWKGANSVEEARPLSAFNICCPLWFPETYTYPTFNISLWQRMDHLGVLTLQHLLLPKGFTQALGKLTNLRVLSLRDLKGFDGLPENFGDLSELKHLTLQLLRLGLIPESFGELSALETLDFYDITGPFTLPESFGYLSSLVTLSIIVCPGLAGLPDSFGSNLTSLEYLKISLCPLIKCLPNSFFQLSGLRRLELGFNALEELGDEFGNLSSLQELDLTEVALQRLPSSFGLLTSLEKLSISKAGNLESLSDNFGKLTHLKGFYLHADEIETLPDSFCHLESLRKFTMLCRKLRRLPHDFGNLSSMEELKIQNSHGSSLESLPDSIGQLHSLRRLQLWGMKNLRSLPDNIGQLTALDELEIRAEKLESVPKKSIEQLHSLRTLRLTRVPNLKSLPDNFGQLRALNNLLIFEAEKLESLPESIGQLHSLRILYLTEVANLKSLPDDFDQLTALEELFIRGAEKLESLPESIGQLHSLRRLTLHGVSNLKSLPDNFGQLRALQELDIQASRLESLPESIGKLQSLKELTIDATSMKSLPESIGELQSLRTLSLEVGSGMSLPKVTKLWPTLQKFTYRFHGHAWEPNLFEHPWFSAPELVLGGQNVRILPEGLGSLSSLRHLHLRLQAFERLPDDVGELSSLQKLTILSDSLESHSLESLSRVTSLRELRLGYCPRLKSLPESLGKPSSLRQLTLPHGDRGIEHRRHAESSHTKAAEGMRLYVYRCEGLSDSVLGRLGWAEIGLNKFGDHWPYSVYTRRVRVQ